MYVCMYFIWIIFLRSISKLITKLNDCTNTNNRVITKINALVEAVNILEQNIELIHKWMHNFRKELDDIRAERVNPKNYSPAVEPLTNFGFRPEVYCTCGKNVTACCPIHTSC